MNNEVIHIHEAEASPLATEYFTKICGFNREGEKIRKMRAEGIAVSERLKDKISIKAVASSFDKYVISGNTAKINGTTFICDAFEQIDVDSIKDVYAYILTAGVYDLQNDAPIMDQIYADIWGTSFADAGLDILKERLAGGAAFEAFGPGFYGMDIDQIGKFFDILNGEELGIEVRNSNLMVPLKSCAGFLIVVDDKSKLPDSDCINCHADHKGCEFCHAVVKNKS